MQPHLSQIATLLLATLLLTCTHSQESAQIPPQQPDMAESIRQQEYATRDSNLMNYENVESYTVKSVGVDSFHITPQVDQDVKCEIYVYWKEANIFISSEYRQGEQVRVLVYEDDQRILYDQSFYMVNGFTFTVRKGSNYEIRFLSQGSIQKLISLTISKMLDSSKPLLDSNDVLSKEQAIGSIAGQIQAFFSISQRNFIVEKKLTEGVLKSTQIYMGYEIVEILLVLLITAMQTIFITKVLNTNSIV